MKKLILFISLFILISSTSSASVVRDNGTLIDEKAEECLLKKAGSQSCVTSLAIENEDFTICRNSLIQQEGWNFEECYEQYTLEVKDPKALKDYIENIIDSKCDWAYGLSNIRGDNCIFKNIYFVPIETREETGYCSVFKDEGMRNECLTTELEYGHLTSMKESWTYWDCSKMNFDKNIEQCRDIIYSPHLFWGIFSILLIIVIIAFGVFLRKITVYSSLLARTIIPTLLMAAISIFIETSTINLNLYGYFVENESGCRAAKITPFIWFMDLLVILLTYLFFAFIFRKCKLWIFIAVVIGYNLLTYAIFAISFFCMD